MRAKPLVYLLMAFLVIGAVFMIVTYQAPVAVLNEEHVSIERSPRMVELLGKPSLSVEEMEELNRESYAHYQKLNPSSQLSFEGWKAKYILRKNNEATANN